MRVDVTVGNVEDERGTAADGGSHLRGIVSALDAAGIEAYSVKFGAGVWQGGIEDSATFTLVGRQYAGFKFARSIVQYATLAMSEDCVLVEWTADDGTYIAELRYSDRTEAL